MKKFFFLLAVFFFLSFGSRMVAFAQDAETQAKIQALDDTIIGLNAQIASKDSEIQKADADLIDAQRKLEEAQKNLENAKTVYDTCVTQQSSFGGIVQTDPCLSLYQTQSQIQETVTVAQKDVNTAQQSKQTLVDSRANLAQQLADDQKQLQQFLVSVPLSLRQALWNLNGVSSNTGETGGSIMEYPKYLPGIAERSLQGNATDITVFIQRLANGIALVAGAVAVLFIVNNAFRMVLAFGNAEKIGKARKGIIWAALGLFLIIMSYVLVKSFIIVPYAGQRPPQCNDQKDNDGDGLIDKEDPGCWVCTEKICSYDPYKDSEEDTVRPACSDNQDNDGDGNIDEQDPGCWEINSQGVPLYNSEKNLETGGLEN